jgi:hypothetical protein
MKKITIKIDCGDEYCEKCHFKYTDIIYKQHTYCRFYNCYLGDATKGLIKRTDKCLEAEDRV